MLTNDLDPLRWCYQGLGSILWFTGGSSQVHDCCFVGNEFGVSTVLVNSDDSSLDSNYAIDGVRRREDAGCDDILRLPGDAAVVNSLNEMTHSCASFDATSCTVVDPTQNTSGGGTAGLSSMCVVLCICTVARNLFR